MSDQKRKLEAESKLSQRKIQNRPLGVKTGQCLFVGDVLNGAHLGSRIGLLGHRCSGALRSFLGTGASRPFVVFKMEPEPQHEAHQHKGCSENDQKGGGIESHWASFLLPVICAHSSYSPRARKPKLRHNRFGSLADQPLRAQKSSNVRSCSNSGQRRGTVGLSAKCQKRTSQCAGLMQTPRARYCHLSASSKWPRIRLAPKIHISSATPSRQYLFCRSFSRQVAKSSGGQETVTR